MTANYELNDNERAVLEVLTAKSYLAAWHITEMLDVKPTTKAGNSCPEIDNLLERGLIAELPDLHLRYKITLEGIAALAQPANTDAADVDGQGVDYGVQSRIETLEMDLRLAGEELARLTAENRTLQAKIKSALWVEGYYHEGSEFGDYERGRAEGWEAARREYRKRLSED